MRRAVHLARPGPIGEILANLTEVVATIASDSEGRGRTSFVPGGTATLELRMGGFAGGVCRRPPVHAEIRRGAGQFFACLGFQALRVGHNRHLPVLQIDEASNGISNPVQKPPRGVRPKEGRDRLGPRRPPELRITVTNDFQIGEAEKASRLTRIFFSRQSRPTRSVIRFWAEPVPPAEHVDDLGP